MIADVLIIASCSFGSALFGLVVGLVLAKSERCRVATFPPTHVSFEPFMSDGDRLRFLEEAAQAIGDGRLSQSNQPQDNRPSNQAAKPGASLEK